MKTTISKIFSTLLPFALIISAYIFFTKTDTMLESQLDIVRYSPYVIFFIGSIIALRFNHSRKFFLVIVLTLCLLAINYIQRHTTNLAEFTDLYLIICLVIPLNIGLFSILKERGILSLWGSIRIGLIISQLLLIFWLINPEQRDVLNYFYKDILALDINNMTSMTQISIVAFLVAFLILAIRYLLYRSSQDISFIAILLSLFYILYNNSEEILYPIFFSASGIILIISILQDSYTMAFSDELTGLPSRRALRQDMLKLGVNYSIAMLDIDFFKKFNDKYGHDTGDDVLKLVASIIRDVTGGGKSYRYGGEEFTILFPGKGVNEVIPHLEELREKISKRGFTIRSKDRPKNKPKKKRKTSKSSRQIFITVSIGVSQKNENNKTPDDVLKSADKALYRAKKKGRNCVSK